MSLFIGKDASGDPIMHITKVNSTISTLKGAPTVDSVFHSSLPYIEHTIYDATNIRSFTNRNVNVYSGGTTYAFSIPAECITSIKNNYCAFIIINTGAGFSTNPAIIGLYIDSGGTVDAANYQQYYFCNSTNTAFSYYADSTYNNIVIGISSGTLVSAKVVVTNVTSAGYQAKTPINTSGILIDNTDIKIHGNGILTYRYISQCPMNTTDLRFSVDNAPHTQFQLVNSVTPESGLKMVTSGDATPKDIEILAGTKRIFYNKITETKMMYQSIISTSILAVEFWTTSSGTYYKDIGTGFEEGDMFLSYFFFPSAGSISVQGKLCKFTIGTITQVVHSAYYSVYGLAAYQLMHFEGLANGTLRVKIYLYNYYLSYIATAAYTINIVKCT